MAQPAGYGVNSLRRHEQANAVAGVDAAFALDPGGDATQPDRGPGKLRTEARMVSLDDFARILAGAVLEVDHQRGAAVE